jgi:hypothetical protein
LFIVNNKMYDNYNSDIFNLFLIKSGNAETSICEFEVNYEKTLQMNRRMECGLVDLNIPLDARITVPHEKLVFIEHIKQVDFDYSIEKSYLKSEYGMIRSDSVINTFENSISTPNYSNNLYLDEITLEEFLAVIKEILEYYNSRFEKIFGKYKLQEEDLFPVSLTKCDISWNSKYKTFSHTTGQVHFEMEEDDGSHGIKMATTYFSITFNETLHRLMNFPIELFPLKSIVFDAHLLPLRNCIMSLFLHNWWNDKPVLYYVHTDIIEESYVNEDKLNLLRIVSNTNLSTNDTIYYNFKQLLFIPVRFESLNSIKISIRDKFGDVLYFNKGFISLTLLIRPIEHL